MLCLTCTIFSELSAKNYRNECFYSFKDNIPNDSLTEICEKVKNKNKTYLLLLFRGKVQGIKETIFPKLIIIDKKDISDA